MFSPHPSSYADLERALAAARADLEELRKHHETALNHAVDYANGLRRTQEENAQLRAEAERLRETMAGALTALIRGDAPRCRDLLEGAILGPPATTPASAAELPRLAGYESRPATGTEEHGDG